MRYDFGRKAREPFRNIPVFDDGVRKSLNHTRKDEQHKSTDRLSSNTKHCYHWKRWFPGLKVGDTVLIHIRDHHDICRMHKDFREHKTEATIWAIDHDRQFITLTVAKRFLGADVNVHIQVIYDPSSPAYVSHNGVNITGKINKEKESKKWQSKQSK